MPDLLQDLFDRAVDLPESKRIRFLAEQCPPELRDDLRGLLRMDRSTDAIWDQPALKAESLASAKAGDPRIGKRLGAYRLVELIGRGGMGRVYRAERDDTEYRQSVAVKLIRYDIDSDETATRFRLERQILATLNHPNIARLIDGGTGDDGLPYLVMEYVAGVPVTRYCQEHELPMAGRLQLFRQVCSAVHYAHQHMVIHRDLKPGNILVTADGVPKLLDFGIAKLAGGDEAPMPLTTTGSRLLTPRYASPEQIRQEPVSSASDIYSLGVALFEILTGRSPYRSKNDHELMVEVCQREPLPPSSFDPSLRGDLENILLKALAREPGKRYASADQFSDDIGRYLEGRPVLAHRDSFAYTLSKFVRRHRIAVAAALVVVASLAGEAVMAVRAERRATRRFNEVRALANSMLFEVHDRLGQTPGTLEARKLLVRRAETYLDRLAQEENDPELTLELARAWDRVGTITFDVSESASAHQKARALAEALVKQDPTRTEYAAQLSESERWVAAALRESGDLSGAIQHYRRGVVLMEQIHGRGTDPSRAGELADAYEDLAPCLLRHGEFREALEIQRRAAKSRAESLARDPGSLERQSASLISQVLLTDALADNGLFQDALDAGRKACAMAKALADRDPGNAFYRRNIWLTHEHLGAALEKSGDAAAALAEYVAGVPHLEFLSRADPGDRGHLRGLAVTYLAQARVLAVLERWAEARSLGERSERISRAQLAIDPTRREAQLDLANVNAVLASVLLHDRSLEAARTRAGESLVLFKALAGHDPASAALKREWANAESVAARVEAAAGREAAADSHATKAKALWSEIRAAGAIRPCDEPDLRLLGLAVNRE